MAKTTVLCMFGGRSAEYEVSLISAHSILSNIDREKYNVETLGITRNGKWLYYTGDIGSIRDDTWHTHDSVSAMLNPDFASHELIIANSDKRLHVDVVFPIMHGDFSEDGTLQGLFEISGIPYVGPGCLSSAVAMDKVFTKFVLNNFDIPQATFIHLTDSEICEDLNASVSKVEQAFEYPVFVKPANAGSSVGTGKARDKETLAQALLLAAKYDHKIIIEEYIKGKEIEVAVMGNDELTASRCGEIDPGSDYYDYDTKYKTSTSSAHIPARISDENSDKIREYAKKIYNVLGCRGLSRVDFFVCENGRIVFNEINTLPGFTTISMYPKLFIDYGYTYSEIIDRLITLALNK